jgi:hypothetical protein
MCTDTYTYISATFIYMGIDNPHAYRMKHTYIHFIHTAYIDCIQAYAHTYNHNKHIIDIIHLQFIDVIYRLYVYYTCVACSHTLNEYKLKNLLFIFSTGIEPWFSRMVGSLPPDLCP